MHTRSRLVVATMVATLLVISPAALAEGEQISQQADHPATGPFHADAELDPTAYALKGFSIHVGIAWRRWRLDLGNYAMAVPRFVHGNADYDVSFDGYGAKLQYFLFAEQEGGFVGVDGGPNRLYLQRRGTNLSARQTQYSLGADAGWRFRIAAGLYVAIWAGLGYTFNPHDVTLAGSVYKNSHLTPFAALHVGYQFR